MIKFIYRFIKHLTILLLISIPLQILGLLILLPVVAFYDIGKLPRALRWFDSADPFTGRNTEVIDRTNQGGWLKDSPAGTYSKLATIWNKYIWIAWRNPTNYFGYKVLGLQIRNWYIIYNQTITSIPVDITDKIIIGDNTGKYPGLQITEIKVNEKIYYEYYWVKPYGTNKCFRFRLGYKFNTSKIQAGEYIQQVFVISPYTGYTGK